MAFEVENKMHTLYGRGILVRVTCCEHEDTNDFSAEYQLIGRPETAKSTPRMFSVMEVLEWVEERGVKESEG